MPLDEALAIGSTDGQEATMAGDLEQISLTDIFQTLSMSKMEGVLRVAHTLEERTLYFHDGEVQDLVQSRPRHRRIGALLRRSGLITPEQLQDALEEQSETKEPLGRIIVAHGAVSQEEIDDLIHYQASEDLYALFTWEHGGFQFFKGAVDSPGFRQMRELAPRFDVGGVLLEVARRADEWQLILETLGSVDEIPMPCEDRDAGEVEGLHATVMEAVDGTRSVREIAELRILGLFDCARTLKDLYEWQMVGPAEPNELLAVADMQFARNDTQRARVTLRTLLDRDEDLDVATRRELATALERCGDPKLASRCLWQAAQDCDGDEALPLMREACRLDKRSPEALAQLRDLLIDHGVEGEELITVSSDLADALADEGYADKALEVVEELETIATDPIGVMARKAKLLQRLARDEEAITELGRLAEIFKRAKREDDLKRVYEQILKLDGRRKDIAKALAVLRVDKRTRRIRMAALAAAVLTLLGSGVAYLQHRATESALAETAAGIRSALDSGDPAQAGELLTAAVQRFGERPALKKLDDRMRREANRRVQAARAKRRDALTAQLAVAADHLEHGDLRDALEAYRQLMTSSEFGSEVRERAKNRMGSLVPLLDKQASGLPRLVPGPVSETQTAEEQRRVLDELERNFQPTDLRRARAIADVASDPLLAELLGPAAITRLTKDAAAITGAFTLAEQRRSQYSGARKQTKIERGLQPVFLRAQEHEAAYEFQAALEDYRLLAERYPASDELKALFRGKVTRYETILAMLAEIAKATAAGDSDTARSDFRALQRAEPNIPFDTLVDLPVRVLSTPPGATVLLAGKVVGKTPLLTRAKPQTPIEIQVTLPGFINDGRKVETLREGSAAFVLAKHPAWQQHTAGSVQRRPICSDDGVAYVTDRSGHLVALDLQTGAERWRYRTGDLNGLLPSPVRAGDRVFVASFDGDLRCLGAADGSELWSREKLPCEATPVLAAGVLVVGTRDGRVVGLTPDGGQELYSERVPERIRVDLVSDGKHVFAVTARGWVVCLRAKHGRELWRQHLRGVVAASPCLTPYGVIVVTDDGVLTCFSTDRGEVRWRREGLGETTLTPALAGDRVLVASARALRTFRASDGQPGPERKGSTLWSSAPVPLGGRVLLGTRSGDIAVLDGRDLSLRYLLRGDGPISAAVAIDGRHRVIAAFESGLVLGFHALP